MLSYPIDSILPDSGQIVGSGPPEASVVCPEASVVRLYDVPPMYIAVACVRAYSIASISGMDLQLGT
jgi:hypothetical protein